MKRGSDHRVISCAISRLSAAAIARLGAELAIAERRERAFLNDGKFLKKFLPDVKVLPNARVDFVSAMEAV